MSTILFVDDEPNVLQGFQRSLRGRFDIETATSGADGLDAIARRGPFAVVVSDMRMPAMDGAQFLARVKECAPDTIRVMLTGSSDQDTAVRAVNQGAIFRFANKPCRTDVLALVLDAALRQHHLVTAERRLLEDTLGGAIRVLTEILSLAEPGQSARTAIMRDLARRVAAAMSIEHAWQVLAATMLAQVGLVAVPPEVLVRAPECRALSGAEQDMLVRVPATGHDLLRHVPRLEGVAAIVRYQAKNFDGTGYPADDVRGEAIPVGARILRVVADVATQQLAGVPADRIVRDLRNRPDVYDPTIVERVSTILRNPGNGAGSAACCEVMLRDLEVGQVFAANVVTNENTVLVVPGTPVTFALRERLANFASTVGVREPLIVHTRGHGGAAP